MEECVNQETKRPIAQPSSPLDLRLKRVTKTSPRLDGGSTDNEEEKENRRSNGNITDAEDIVCAPSIPCMIMSPSSSPPSTGHKTPHLRPGSAVLPTANGVIQKPRTPVDMRFDCGPEKNGNFSVSSLLQVSDKLENMKQEPSSNDQPLQQPANVQTAGGHRYNPVHAGHARNIVIVPNSAASVLPPGIVHQGDLINTAALPFFTSEMAMRLQASNPAIDAVGGGLLPGHQFFLKQGPSKCESCNIVFCKYENFLAHKKHYCASRPPLPPPPQQQNNNADADDVDKTSTEGSPGLGKPPLTVCSPQSSKDSVSPTPMQLKPPLIQFICSTCGVKFSSFDNLTTHQSFYCPNTMAVPQDAAAQPDKPLVKCCPKCKVSIST